MKKRSGLSFDDIYHYYSQFGLKPEEVDQYIDEYRRFGFIEEWIDEDGFIILQQIDRLSNRAPSL